MKSFAQFVHKCLYELRCRTSVPQFRCHTIYGVKHCIVLIPEVKVMWTCIDFYSCTKIFKVVLSNSGTRSLLSCIVSSLERFVAQDIMYIRRVYKDVIVVYT
jgi:hypothetical protein